MKTGIVKYINMVYEVYRPNGELLAFTNTFAGIAHCLKRYGLKGYILHP
jgi:hypothetical protein